MKRLILFMAFSLSACSGAEERHHEEMMRRVERLVQLPKGAPNLEKYARYYSVDGDRVISTYITFVDPENQHYDLPVGQGRWISDRLNLPAISDGGCSVVNVLYNPKAEDVPEAFCNGET